MHIAIMIQYQNAFSNSFLIDGALAYLCVTGKESTLWNCFISKLLVDYRLVRLLHLQALSLLILLLVLILPRVMSGQVRLYLYIFTNAVIYEECSSVINMLNLVFIF